MSAVVKTATTRSKFAVSNACEKSFTPLSNLRTRVSTWLSGLVEEVRRKSPSSLQKWTESPPQAADNSVKINAENHAQEQPNNKNSEEKSPDVEGCKEIKIDVPSPGEERGGNRFWIKETFLNKLNKSLEPSNTEKDELSTVTQLTSLGKIKINDFYDKVRLNKARYNLLKTQKMDRKSTVVYEDDKTLFKHTEVDEEEVSMQRGESIDKAEAEDMCATMEKFDDNSEFSFDIDNFSLFSRKIKLGEIGRSSTSKASYNNIKIEPEKKPSQLLSPPKNINLANIGRSFSEQNDDEDDDYLLNERSRSYSQVSSNRMAKRNDNKNNNNVVSSSLPSFFENKSMSTSPVSVKTGPVREQSFSFSDCPRRGLLLRDSSFQSDSSHCSSVESLLESRKPDPEAILINLGFGPVESEDILSRIPKRFLKPSQVRGIDTEAFLRRQQLASHLHDHSVLGYRGLLGNPDIPPSMIVAKIMERFELNERNRCIMDINLNRPQSAPPTPGPNQ